MQRHNKEFQALTYGVIKAGVIVFLLFCLFTSCTKDELDEDIPALTEEQGKCGAIEVRTETLIGSTYVWILGMDNGDVIYVTPSFYYDTYIGLKICY